MSEEVTPQEEVEEVALPEVETVSVPEEGAL